MQWFKSAMVVSSAVFVAAMAANGCSSTPAKDDGGADIKAPDVKPHPDGGDAAPGCASGLACENCDVTGYTAVQQGKPVAMPGSCTAAQLQAFVTACFSSTATQNTCTTWTNSQPDGGNCATCLSPVLQSSANWGPFDCATSTSPCGANSGGCVDLVTKTVTAEKGQGGAGSCGDLVTVNFGCQDYACGTCATSDFQTCDQSATANECKSYVDAVTSTTGPCGPINGDAAPPKAQSCFPQTDADNVNFVDIFCGTGPT